MTSLGDLTKKYTDLVSDEKVNRSVLDWITQIERLNSAQKAKTRS